MDEVAQKFRDGLNTLLVAEVDEEAVNLSGGQVQKLMLARAIYKNAPILLLDEPTAALDPIAEKIFIFNIMKWQKERCLSLFHIDWQVQFFVTEFSL